MKDELGADAVDQLQDRRRSHRRRSPEAAPEGIDVYFDNVGGDHLDAALAVANMIARFAICGMIAQYNDETPPPGPRNLAALIVKRIAHAGLHHPRLSDLRGVRARWPGWLAAGRIKSRDTVVEGLENAPKAFLGLFSGDNTGKMLVKLADH